MMKPTRIKFARMPFDFGDDPARSCPDSGLISEIGVVAPYLVGRPSDGPRQQIADPILQDAVCRRTDRIFDALGFEIHVDVRIGEACVGAEIEARDLAAITRHHWPQHALPSIGAVDVAVTQGATFQIAELIEDKQRMITGALVVTVLDGALLLAMRWTHARIHIEHDVSWRPARVNAVDPLAGKSNESG